MCDGARFALVVAGLLRLLGLFPGLVALLPQFLDLPGIPGPGVGFRLFGHGSLHFRRQIDMLQLNRGDFDTPGIGVGVEYFLKFGVDFFPRRQQLVQFRLTAYAS